MNRQAWLQHPWRYGLLVAAWLWLFAAMSHSAQVDPPLDQLYFHSAVSHGGRGCPERQEAPLSAQRPILFFRQAVAASLAHPDSPRHSHRETAQGQPPRGRHL